MHIYKINQTYMCLQDGEGLGAVGVTRPCIISAPIDATLHHLWLKQQGPLLLQPRHLYRVMLLLKPPLQCRVEAREIVAEGGCQLKGLGMSHDACPMHQRRYHLKSFVCQCVCRSEAKALCVSVLFLCVIRLGLVTPPRVLVCWCVAVCLPQACNTKSHYQATTT